MVRRSKRFNWRGAEGAVRLTVPTGNAPSPALARYPDICRGQVGPSRATHRQPTLDQLRGHGWAERGQACNVHPPPPAASWEGRYFDGVSLVLGGRKPCRATHWWRADAVVRRQLRQQTPRLISMAIPRQILSKGNVIETDMIETSTNAVWEVAVLLFFLRIPISS